MARCKIEPTDYFVIFVVLLDVFDHFGQTFVDINISIESLTHDSPYEGCRDTSVRILFCVLFNISLALLFSPD
jgi:hypothetical protein